MEPATPIPELQSESPQPPPMSLAGRLVNVLVTPGDVFDQVKASPHSVSNWLVPALVLILVSWVCAGFIFAQPVIQQQLQEITEQSIQKQAERMHMSAEQTEQMRQNAEKFGGIGQKVAAVVSPVVLAFCSPFFWGLVLWLVGSRLYRGGFPYLKAVEVVGLSNGILVLATILKTLLVISLGNMFASPSLGLLVLKHFDATSIGHSLLFAADVTVFWVLAVRAIGMGRLSGVSWLKSAVWIFGVWAAYTGFFLAVGWAAQKVFGG